MTASLALLRPLLRPLLVGALGASGLAQTTWYVDAAASPGGDGSPGAPYATLSAAIAAATTVDGDTVLVLPGTYVETVDYGGKALAIVAQGGALVTTLDGGASGPVVTIASGEGPGTALVGFTITNGFGAAGAGLRSAGTSPYVQGCRFLGNDARPANGGGLACTGGSVVVEDCLFRLNRAYRGGGVDCVGATVVLRRCTLDENLTEDVLLDPQPPQTFRGGAVHASQSTVELEDCVLRDNRARCGDGGAIYLATSAGRIADSLFEDNRAGAVFYPCADLLVGGGALRVDDTSTAIVERCTFDGNGAYYGAPDLASPTLAHGGAVWGPAEISASTFTGNSVEGRGGATFDARLTSCALDANAAFLNLVDQGGEGGSVAGGTLVRCTVENGFAARLGGGAWNAELERSAVRACRAGVLGGGVHGGTATDCVLADNVASSSALDPPDGIGGGAFSTVLVGCRLERNTAHEGGGAAASVLERTVLRANVAQSRGGGAWASHLDRCTVLANRAEVASGGVGAALSTVASSIVRDNLPDQLDAGATVSFSDVTGAWPGPGNFDLDPELWGPLVGDVHLIAGSPCIDAGDPGAPLDPDGTRADVGALSYDPGHLGAPGRYCFPKATSAGCLARVGWSGTPSVTGPDDFHVTAQAVNQASGLFFYGTAAAQTPLFEGWLCVGGAIVRTAPQHSGGSAPPANDCSGSFDFHFSQAEMAAHGLAAGDTVYGQYRFRDVLQADGTGVGLTDGIELTLHP